MPKQKFKIFATDGENIWELFFIVQESKGDFYFGIDSLGLKGKFSRHKSGKAHLKAIINGETVYLDQGFRQKLSEFKGREQLIGISISTDKFDRFRVKPYKGKKFDGSAFIDIRNYKGQFNINPFLIEPYRLELLNDLPTLYDNSQIIILTQSNPWIVLVINEPEEI